MAATAQGLGFYGLDMYSPYHKLSVAIFHGQETSSELALGATALIPTEAFGHSSVCRGTRDFFQIRLDLDTARGLADVPGNSAV